MSPEVALLQPQSSGDWSCWVPACHWMPHEKHWHDLLILPVMHKCWSGLGYCGHADLPVRKPVNGGDCLALAVLQVSEGLIL